MRGVFPTSPTRARKLVVEGVGVMWMLRRRQEGAVGCEERFLHNAAKDIGQYASECVPASDPALILNLRCPTPQPLSD